MRGQLRNVIEVFRSEPLLRRDVPRALLWHFRRIEHRRRRHLISSAETTSKKPSQLPRYQDSLCGGRGSTFCEIRRIRVGAAADDREAFAWGVAVGAGHEGGVGGGGGVVQDEGGGAAQGGAGRGPRL